MQKRIDTRAKPGRATKKVRGAGPRDPERTSAAILAAAVKEFHEKGYSGARIDAIAARAGANKRMIYHYFGDKEALYLAVLESGYVGIRSAEAGLRLADLPPKEAIERLIDFTWLYFLDHPEFLSLLNTENLHRAKYLKRSARVFNLHSPLVAALSDILKRGRTKRRVPQGRRRGQSLHLDRLARVLLLVEPLDAVDHLPPEPVRSGRVEHARRAHQGGRAWVFATVILRRFDRFALDLQRQHIVTI